MILPIYIYGQPVLRKESEDIATDYPNLKELLANMFETMEEANGVGLAAPQIGLNIRVVVIDLDVLSEDFPEYKGFKKGFINPHIIEYDDTDTVSLEEGCLSLPGISEKVTRPTKVHVQYLDEDLQLPYKSRKKIKQVNVQELENGSTAGALYMDKGDDGHGFSNS